MENSGDVLVYHGSNCIVSKPDLRKCKRGKDFGRGFYVTTDKRQAINFAKIIATRNGESKGVVNVYKIKLDLISKVQTYCFKTTNQDWLFCVIGHRDSKYKSFAEKWSSYDVIVGKIADDDTSQVINAYLSGAYGLVGSKTATNTAIKMFAPNRLKDQMCFRTEKTVNLIRFVECFEVDV